MADTSLSATVAICTRNRGDRIAATVASVLANKPADFEVLIIDQSDGDETADCLRRFDDKRLRVMRSDTRGIGPSRRLAVEEATGDVVVFTDDDCTVPEGWVMTMTDVFTHHDDVGMAFCNVFPAAHDPSLGFVPAYERPGEHLVRTPREKNQARGIGAGMAVRKTSALAVGNFDHAIGSLFPRVVNEEGDLALRMILGGHAVFETDKTSVTHDGFRTWQQGRDLARRNFAGIGFTYAKPLRVGRWDALPVLLHEGLVVVLGEQIGKLLRGQRAGFRGFIWFWYGFARSLRHRVDPDTLNFVQPADHDQQ